jgi:hypothetical protein
LLQVDGNGLGPGVFDGIVDRLLDDPENVVPEITRPPLNV